MLRRTHSPAHRALAGFLAAQMVFLPVASAVAAEAPPEETVAEPQSSPVTEENQPAEERPDISPELREEIAAAAEAAAGGVPYSAPTPAGGGEGQSGATPQAIALPTAEGSIQGMGESFSPILTSGAATYTVPIALPPGRAGFGPQLSLAYSSTAGSSDVGFGWSLGVPFIARQSDRGLPRYVDAPMWQALEDRFFFNGGQELVPVDSAAAEAVDCGGTPGCAPVPEELAGWQQYRARLEGGYQRFFRSPDGRRWVVQGKNGARLDFGALPAGDAPGEAVAGSTAALESEYPAGEGRVYRWLLTRASDAHGSVTYYLYDEDEGHRYLTDIYYLSPASCALVAGADERMRCAAPFAEYGRRVRLVYEGRPDEHTSYVSGWAIRTTRRLARIEVTAAPGAPGARTLVRRYHLGYDAGSFHSLLTSVQVEGRPETVDGATGAVVGLTDVPEESLGDAVVGPLLPPLTFRYREPPAGGVDATVHVAESSPPHSVSEDRADLFDVNSDGLPDLIVTDPARYETPDGSPAVGVFFNGFAGDDARPAEQAGTFSGPVPMPVDSDLAAVMTLSNANVRPMDLDGDGRADLLHMPRTASYGYFTPTRNGDPLAVSPAEQGWRWSHVDRWVPDGETDPRIDLAGDGGHIRVFDVNNDHLIDVVRTTGTRIQTWLNLGWLPDGDGRFGSAVYEGGAWTLSTAPVESCLPVAGTPLDFADPAVRLGDLNGDGLQDIVRVRRDDVVYWPGRGGGVWGVGAGECPPGLIGGRHVTMASPPAELNLELEGVYLADVDADGADDVVQVRWGEIDVWFNRAGAAFTERVIAHGTPFTLGFAGRVRLADLDGSGTVDVVFAEADDWKWVDLMGGARPRLLVAVDGGLGALTELSYSTSAADYLADLRAADGCTADCDGFTWTQDPGECDAKVLAATGECAYRSGGSPVVSTVVREVTTTDRFDRVGREENRRTSRYAYHDGYYDGIEQEFRGFGAADVEEVGGPGHLGGYARTYFHQGRRPTALASERLAQNPDEILKGRPYLAEAHDTGGKYLSTAHTTYVVRKLHEGLGGVDVFDAYARQTDELRYDVYGFVASGDPLVLPRLVHADGVEESGEVAVRGTRWAHLRATVDEIDAVGHVRRATRHGRLSGEDGEPLPDERIIAHEVPLNVAGSGSGWLWRSEESWVEGADAAPLGRTTRVWSGAGDELSSTVHVTQDDVYPFGDLGSPLPEDLVTTATYDDWGNVTAGCAGSDAESGADCLRYRTMAYDADWAAFAETESVAVRRGGGGFETLDSHGEWDRGLGALFAATDPNDERSSVTYDGFGRLTAAVAPPVAGCAAGAPSTRIQYLLTTTPETVPVSRVTATTFLSCTDETEATDTISFVDGLGRVRAVLATGDDDGDRLWVKSGVATFTDRGAVRRAYQPAFFSAPTANLAAVLAVPGSPHTTATYDSFGRQIFFDDADGSRTEWRYHALATETWDPLDRGSGPEADTPTIERVDGHGRGVGQVLINRHPLGTGELEYYQLWTTYRADGAVATVQRAQTPSDGPELIAEALVGRQVTRTFEYDSAGRRIATTDPDTDSRAVVGSVWRYLFNRAGDLVSVRDPRGCGQDFYYDHAGRLLAEEYAACAEAQAHEAPAYTVPAGAIGLGETTIARPAHVRHFYDGYDGTGAPPLPTIEGYPADAGGVLGRPTGTADRAQRSIVAYDRRGNVVWQARQVALIPAPGQAPSSLSSLPGPAGDDGPPGSPVVEYDEGTEQHTYVVARAYDHGNRPGAILLPRDPDYEPEAGEPTPLIAGRLVYGRRGLPVRAVATGGAVWPTIADGGMAWPSGTELGEQVIVADIEYESDGLAHRTVYGDDAGGSRAPTTTTTDYDSRRRPERSSTVRTPTAGPTPEEPRPAGAVTVVYDQEFDWDAASNLRGITDHRIAAQWPEGHKPQSMTIDHDALYRVIDVGYKYTQDDGTRTPFDAASDWRTEYGAARAADPMRGEPAPMAVSVPEGRVASLTWQYDWLGNLVHWGDDAHAFYERSIGTITNGADDASGTDRPSALYVAADMEGPPEDRGGWVELDYGDGGNVVSMTVHAGCHAGPTGTCEDPGGTNRATRRDALAACVCDVEQHYQYRWDELNRLAEARRYDRAGGGDAPWELGARQRYRYDGANQRIVKETLDPTPGDGVPSERVALSVYPGDLERRGLVRGEASYDADPTLDTETHYLVVGARLVWQSGDPLLGLDPDHRITIPITDLLGTTGAVLDLKSGEPIEHSTYYPNGARETFVTTAIIAPEPAGFTGKEADDEVGLVYFGERYLIPRLGRWASPDPLAIHALGGGEAMNSYHYVSGNLLQARDPLGLEGDQETRRVVTSPSGERHYSDDPGYMLDFAAEKVVFGVDWGPKGTLQPGFGVTYVVEGQRFTTMITLGEIWRPSDSETYPANANNLVELPGGVTRPRVITPENAPKLYPVMTKLMAQYEEETDRLAHLGVAVGGLALISTMATGVVNVMLALAEAPGLFAASPRPTAPRRILYHYTDEAGLEGINRTNQLRPSLRSTNPRDVRYGNGQYLSDIVPGTKTPAQLSRAFLGHPFRGARFTRYIAIDVTDLPIVQGRAGVFVNPSEVPLDLAGRIVGTGEVSAP